MHGRVSSFKISQAANVGTTQPSVHVKTQRSKRKLLMSTISKRIILISAVVTAVAGLTTNAAAAGDEKCFGVSLAGENDCAAGLGTCEATMGDTPARACSLESLERDIPA